MSHINALFEIGVIYMNLEVQKKCLKYDHLCSKMRLFQVLFLDFQIQQLAILKPVDRKKLYTSKESPITCRLKAILNLEESLS